MDNIAGIGHNTLINTMYKLNNMCNTLKEVVKNKMISYFKFVSRRCSNRVHGQNHQGRIWNVSNAFVQIFVVNNHSSACLDTKIVCHILIPIQKSKRTSKGKTKTTTKKYFPAKIFSSNSCNYPRFHLYYQAAMDHTTLFF